MRPSRIGTGIRSQRYGIAMGVVALLVAVGGPAKALEGASSAVDSGAKALRIAKKADRRSKRALRLAKQLSVVPGPQGEKGQKGEPGVPGQDGAPGSDAQFNGASAGGSLTGTYPDPLLGLGVVDTAQLANGAVTDNTIENGAVGGVQIADGSVRAADLGPITIRTATVSVSGGGTPQNGNWDSNTVGVECVGGERRLSGGASWDTGAFNDELLIVNSYPFGAASWYAVGGNDTGAVQTLKVHILCLAP